MSKEEIDLRNIDVIIKYFKKNCNDIIKIDKLDGITMECYIDDKKEIQKVIDSTIKICKKLKLIPYSTEINKSKDNVFILQFPELNPQYNQKELDKIYNSSFKWLLDDTIKFDHNNKVTKELLLQYKDIVVKESISMYFRCNTNQYKDNINNYLNNTDYKNLIDASYLSFLQTYIMEK